MLYVQNRDDPRAFALLIRRWQDRIRWFCARRIGDLHLGEDLAQEVFMRVFQHRKDYRNDGRFSVYLYRIALNVCYDQLRRLKRHGRTSTNGHGVDDPPGDAGPEAPGPTPAAAAVEHERAELLRQALLQMPAHYQDVIILRHYQGLKFREIAHVLGIPDGTVKSRMAEALTRLARLLGPTLGEEARRGSPGPPCRRQDERKQE